MKQIIVTSIVSLSLLFGCDYMKNDKMSPEKKLELSEKCNRAGKEYFKEFIRTNLPEGFLWDEPEYNYSSKLNTCLIHIRYVGPGKISTHRNQVIDIFANKPILYGWFERDTEKNTETKTEPTNIDVPNNTSNEYYKQKDKLFRE